MHSHYWHNKVIFFSAPVQQINIIIELPIEFMFLWTTTKLMSLGGGGGGGKISINTSRDQLIRLKM